MNSLDQMRSLFLKYYFKNGHYIAPSAPLIPKNDNSLLFTSAGMVPFKKQFLLNQPWPSTTSSQKCLRVVDIERVGHTNYHHTFFEMLGNFSFGEYGRYEAIELAFNFLTKELQLSPNKLIVTVHKNDDKTHEAWKKIAPASTTIHITEENFWSIKGHPAGFCTEIFHENLDLEIWNIVFVEHVQVSDSCDSIEKLPLNGGLQKRLTTGIDTGMGLERICAVVQGTQDNYDIDVFQALISASHEFFGDKDKIVEHKVMSDHIRAAAFLIAEGMKPGNKEHGYVLRRIIRRMVRCFSDVYHVVTPLVEIYPDDLLPHKENIISVIKEEELKFKNALAQGVKLLNKLIKDMGTNPVMSGANAFKLHDTCGFPIDMIQDVLKEHGKSVNLTVFNQLMNKQKRKEGND